MGFKNDIPEYKSISNSNLYMHSVPDDVWTPMESLIRKSAKSASKLRAIINDIAEITGGQLTNNWGWDYLENDIYSCVSDIRKKVSGGKIKHFEAFMDSLAILHSTGDLSIDSINEFLEDHGIGYKCNMEIGGNLTWYAIEGTEVIDAISETQEQVKSISQQAYERFERAKRQFEDGDNDERARKDAFRSCVDAMEALIKELGADDEIGEATKHLRDEKNLDGTHIWGLVQMIKDGNTLFNLLHELYPDVRHGTQDFNTADMSMEEAEYFVGRITVFMKYIASRAKKLGKF